MSFNGYKNYQTWNVVASLCKDQEIRRYVNKYLTETPRGRVSYKDFVKLYLLQKTFDGILYNDARIDVPRLDTLLYEMSPDRRRNMGE